MEIMILVIALIIGFVLAVLFVKGWLRIAEALSVWAMAWQRISFAYQEKTVAQTGKAPSTKGGIDLFPDYTEEK